MIGLRAAIGPTLKFYLIRHVDCNYPIIDSIAFTQNRTGSWGLLSLYTSTSIMYVQLSRCQSLVSHTHSLIYIILLLIFGNTQFLQPIFRFAFANLLKSNDLPQVTPFSCCFLFKTTKLNLFVSLPSLSLSLSFLSLSFSISLLNFTMDNR